MYCGAYQLGDEMTITAVLTDGDGKPAWPDEAPHVDFWWMDTGDMTESMRMAPVERYRQPATFGVPVFFDWRFRVGHYVANIRYLLGGTKYHETLAFEIKPGGNTDGSNLAIREYRKAGGNFVIQHRRSGRIAFQRNPQVT